MPDMTTIRRLVLANRGGHEGDTDAQILMLWDSMDAEAQQSYIDKDANARRGDTPHAPGNGPRATN